MDKQLVKSMIKNKKIIAILRGVEKDKIINVVQALIDGGINLLEITFDHKELNYMENTAEKIELLKGYFKDKICIGAGTVLSTEEVEKAVNCGAEFIISPNINSKVIKKTNELNKVSIPGALTPTEVVYGYELGADFIKIFPAEGLGKNYIKALMGPLQHIPLIAVGGIDCDNIKEFLELGLDGVGIGGKLIERYAIECNEYERITKIAEKFIKNSKIGS